MIERPQLTALLLVAAAVWAAALYAKGVTVSLSWLQPLSIVVGCLLLVLAAFDVWVWKWQWLHPWFVKRPIVDGTWRVEIRSTWVDPQTKQQAPVIPACMVIRQRHSRISLRLITEESRSELLGASVVSSDDGLHRIAGVYRSEPQVAFRARSAIHYGALVLQANGTAPERLEGHYWTDRNTAGDVTLFDRQPEYVDDWGQAKRLYRID